MKHMDLGLVTKYNPNERIDTENSPVTVYVRQVSLSRTPLAVNNFILQFVRTLRRTVERKRRDFYGRIRLDSIDTPTELKPVADYALAMLVKNYLAGHGNPYVANQIKANKLPGVACFKNNGFIITSNCEVIALAVYLHTVGFSPNKNASIRAGAMAEALSNIGLVCHVTHFSKVTELELRLAAQLLGAEVSIQPSGETYLRLADPFKSETNRSLPEHIASLLQDRLDEER